jgi:hypothetical protein
VQEKPNSDHAHEIANAQARTANVQKPRRVVSEFATSL